ncbi:DUF4365 domain-containing protein [Tepidibacillus marianensis]|uniref:DUF4365 domain-containing protein n=1 Tax=Tepidibacillus marianensis TaxID=3131995 RepID=UPI0030CC8829
MPKYKSNKKTENKGILFIEYIVNERGSIFRQVPGEKDTGIDGFIEFVDEENVTGEMVAVQVKSGESYFNEEKQQFELNVDKDKLDYWCNLYVPVVIVFYNPILKIGNWEMVKEYVEYQEYKGISPVKKIEVPITRNKLTIESFSEIREYGRIHADSKQLLKCVEDCLSDDIDKIINAFSMLIEHPHTRKNKLPILIANQLLEKKDENLIKEVIWLLGYGVGRNRWSFNPSNKQEIEVSDFASSVCSKFTKDDIYKMLCLLDEESFYGPMALGERFLDIISCCLDNALEILEKVMYDKSEPIVRRYNAFILSLGCDDLEIEEVIETGSYSEKISDVIEWIVSVRKDIDISAKTGNRLDRAKNRKIL